MENNKPSYGHEGRRLSANNFEYIGKDRRTNEALVRSELIAPANIDRLNRELGDNVFRRDIEDSLDILNNYYLSNHINASALKMHILVSSLHVSKRDRVHGMLQKHNLETFEETAFNDLRAVYELQNDIVFLFDLNDLLISEMLSRSAPLRDAVWNAVDGLGNSLQATIIKQKYGLESLADIEARNHKSYQEIGQTYSKASSHNRTAEIISIGQAGLRKLKRQNNLKFRFLSSDMLDGHWDLKVPSFKPDLQRMYAEVAKFRNNQLN